MLERGYVHVYTGDGKGKTTAALGLAVRAALSGLHVFAGQFMKGQDYSELAIDRLPWRDVAGGSIEIAQYGTPRLLCRGEKPGSEDLDRARAGIADLRGKLSGRAHDVVIADEICVAHHFGLVTLEDVLGLLDSRPASVELVLTGRKAPQELIDRADLVTDMREVRHYFASQGVRARKGIEM